MKQAQADVQYVAAAKAFDKGDFGTFLDEFFKAIHSRYDIEKPNVQRLIRRKLNIINRLKEENRALKQAALEKEKALVKYAREYILMGDECLKHDMKEAAMKNYEKAVTLCPKFKEAWKKIKKLEKEMLKGESLVYKPIIIYFAYNIKLKSISAMLLKLYEKITIPPTCSR